jgi:hypothetical protein
VPWIQRGQAFYAMEPASHPLSARRPVKGRLQYVSGEAIFTVSLRYCSPAAGHAHTDA